MELVLAGFIFAILGYGMLLIFNKGMESLFFERDELAVQSDIRSVMDQMTDKLRQATSVTGAKKDDIVFDADGYYYKNKNVYEGRLPVPLYGEGNQLNSQGIEVIDFSFSYYGEDMAPLTTNPDPDAPSDNCPITIASSPKSVEGVVTVATIGAVVSLVKVTGVAVAVALTGVPSSTVRKYMS